MAGKPPWTPADLCGHLDKQGHSDSKWRRRYCALKAHQLFILRAAASLKPLAVLHLSGARITASKTPLHRDDDGSDGGGRGSSAGGGNGSDVLWVLRVALQDSRGHQLHSGHSKFKLATPSQELQELWVDALQQAAAVADATPVADEAIQRQLPDQQQQQQRLSGVRRPSTAPAYIQHPGAAAAAAAAARPVGRGSGNRASELLQAPRASLDTTARASELVAAEPAEPAAAGPDRRRARSSVGVRTLLLLQQPQQQWLLQEGPSRGLSSQQEQEQQLAAVVRRRSSNATQQQGHQGRDSFAAGGLAAVAGSHRSTAVIASDGEAADADIESDGEAGELQETAYHAAQHTRHSTAGRTSSTGRLSCTGRASGVPAVLQGLQYAADRSSDERRSQVLLPVQQQLPSSRQSLLLLQRKQPVRTSEMQPPRQRRSSHQEQLQRQRTSLLQVHGADSRASLKAQPQRVIIALSDEPGRFSTSQQQHSRHDHWQQQQQEEEQQEQEQPYPPRASAVRASSIMASLQQGSRQPMTAMAGANRGASQPGSRQSTLHPWQELSEPLGSHRVSSKRVSSAPGNSGPGQGGAGMRLTSGGGELSQLEPQGVTQLQFMAARLSQTPPARQHSSSERGRGSTGSSSSSGSSDGSAGGTGSNSGSSSSSSTSSDADASGGSDTDSSRRRSRSTRRSSGSADRQHHAGSRHRRRVQQPLPMSWGLSQFCCWLVNPVSSGDSSDSSIDSDSTMQSWGKRGLLSSSSDSDSDRRKQRHTQQLPPMQDQLQRQQPRSSARAPLLQQPQQRRSSGGAVGSQAAHWQLQPPSQQRMSGRRSAAGSQQQVMQLAAARPRSASAVVHSPQPLLAEPLLVAAGAGRRHSTAAIFADPAAGAAYRASATAVHRTSAAASSGVGEAGAQFITGHRPTSSHVVSARRSQMEQVGQQQGPQQGPLLRQQQSGQSAAAARAAGSRQWVDQGMDSAPLDASEVQLQAFGGPGPASLHEDDVAADVSFGSRVKESPSLAVWYSQQAQSVHAERQQQEQLQQLQRISKPPAMQQQLVSHVQHLRQEVGAFSAAHIVLDVTAGGASMMPQAGSSVSASRTSGDRMGSRSVATSMTGLLQQQQQQQQQPPGRAGSNSQQRISSSTPSTVRSSATASSPAQQPAGHPLQQWIQPPSNPTQDLVWGSGAGDNPGSWPGKSEPGVAGAGPGSIGAPAQVLQIMPATGNDDTGQFTLYEPQLQLQQQQVSDPVRFSGSSIPALSGEARGLYSPAPAAAAAGAGYAGSSRLSAGQQPRPVNMHVTAGEWWGRRRPSQTSADEATAAAARSSAATTVGGASEAYMAAATPPAAAAAAMPRPSGFPAATAAAAAAAFGLAAEAGAAPGTGRSSAASTTSTPAGLLRGSGAADLQRYDGVSKQLRSQVLQQQQQQLLYISPPSPLPSPLLQPQPQLHEHLPAAPTQQASLGGGMGAATADQHALAPSIACAVKRFERLLQQQQQQQQEHCWQLFVPLHTPKQLLGSAAGVATDVAPSDRFKHAMQTAVVDDAAGASQGMRSRQLRQPQPQQLPDPGKFPAAVLNPLFEPAAANVLQPARGSSKASAGHPMDLLPAPDTPTAGAMAAAFLPAAADQQRLQHVAALPWPSVLSGDAQATVAAAPQPPPAAAAGKRAGPPPAPPLPPGSKLLMADKASNPASSASIPAVAGVHGAAVAKATAMQAAAAVAGPLGGISPGEAATGALPAALAVAQTGRDALLQAIRGGAKLQHVHRASLVAAQQAGLL